MPKKKKILLFLVAAVLFSIFSFLIYIKHKGSVEIDLSYVNFYIEKKISGIFTNADVKVQDSSISWDKSDNDWCLILKDLTVVNSGFVMTVPKLLMKFKFTPLFGLRTSLSQVLADNLHIYINIEKNKKFNFDVQDLPQVIRELFLNLDAESTIELTNITITQGEGNISYIDKFHVSKSSDSNGLNVHLYTKSDNESLENLSLVVKNRSDTLSVRGTFHDLKISKIFPSIRGYQLNKNVGLKGNLSLRINANNKITDGSIYILNTKKCSNYPDKILTFNDTNINLVYNEGILNIKNFSFTLNDQHLFLSGMLNTKTRKMLLSADVDKLTAQDLCLYMPDSMNNKFRDWICNDIDGIFSNVVANFSCSIKDLVNGNFSGVTVIAHIGNGRVKFDEDFEEVRDLTGTLNLKSNDLNITVDHAKFQNITIDSSSIKMKDLDGELAIDGHATSNAYALYEPIRFKLDKTVVITEDKINGKADTRFDIKVFNLNNDNKKANFLANFHSRVDNLTIYNADIGIHNIKLNFGDDFINLSSTGIVNDKQLKFDLNSSDKNETFDAKLIGDLPAQIMNLVDIGGYINVTTELTTKQDDTGSIRGSVDLSNLISHSSYLGWKNKFEDHNKIAFDISMQGANQLLLNELKVTGKELDIKLSGGVKNGNFHLYSDNFKLLNNDFAIEAISNREKNTINIYGEMINISDIFGLVLKKNSTPSGDIEVNMNVNSILMKDGISINNAKLDLTCFKGECQGSKFTGQFAQDGSDISAQYSEIGLEVYADNAGLLLQSLGISKSIHSGKISFYLSPKRNGHERYGSVSINRLYIKDAPLLTTLLSLSSLPSIVNALNNEGIYFYRCNIPFSYKDNIINIEKLLAEGAELGISSKGRFDIKGNRLQLEGQVIPAYLVNKYLANIPIIRLFRAGGKSRGVFAIDYKVTGDGKNNSVFVDFISSLTPNLLKRVLGVFDTIIIKTNQAIRSYIPNFSDIKL